MDATYMPVDMQAQPRYKTLPGRNIYCCKGKTMTSKDPGAVHFTWVVLTAGVTIYFVFTAPYIADNVTLGLPLLTAYVVFLTAASLLRAWLSNPGIIPRATKTEGEGSAPEPADVPPGQYTAPARNIKVDVKGCETDLKYCMTCHVFRPPRASHCSVCDNCVDGFDHHCPWIGNCVGARNYRYFYCFVLFLSTLCLLVLAQCITQLAMRAHEEGETVGGVVGETPSIVILIVLTFGSLWMVGGLACYHTSLISNNLTTHEYLRHRRGAANPFNRGSCCRNFRDVLCKPQLPDRLRAWELVEVFADGGESEGGGSMPSSPARPFRVGLDDPEDGGATNEVNLIPQRSAADDR